MLEQFNPKDPLGQPIKIIVLFAIFYVALLRLYFGSKLSIIIWCITYIFLWPLYFKSSNPPLDIDEEYVLL